MFTVLAIGVDRAGVLLSTPGVRHHSHVEATRRLGILTGADVVVFGWPPGQYPTIEQHVFTGGAGALYVSVSPEQADVGPYIAASLTPCPTCHAAHTSAPAPGTDATMAAWASSWIDLELSALRRHNSTDLVARSYRWEVGSPGLQELTWRRLPGCRRLGCVNPD